MFLNTITESELTKFGIFDSLFPKISGTPYMGDTSFTDTLAFLLEGKEYDSIKVSFDTHFLSQEEIEHPTIFLSNLAEKKYQNEIFIFSIENEMDVEPLFKVIENELPDLLQKNSADFQVTKEINKWMWDKNFPFYSIISENLKSSIVILNKLNIQKWHFMQTICCKILPWFFKGGVSDQEKEFIRTLAEKSPQKYIEQVSNFASRKNVEDVVLRNRLKEFDNTRKKRSIRNLEEDIRAESRSIENLIRQIREQELSKERKQMTLLGLLNYIKGSFDSAETLNYFLSNKNIKLDDVNDYQLSFYTNSYYDYFDSEMAETMIENSDSYFYESIDSNHSEFDDIENRRLLLKSIFSDSPIFRIRACSWYKFELGDAHVVVESEKSFPIFCKDRIPNPHIQYHACLGDHRRVIEEGLIKEDYIGAISQCISSCSSLNISENISVDKLIADLFADDYGRPLEDQDGNLYNTKEALDFLKKEKN